MRDEHHIYQGQHWNCSRCHHHIGSGLSTEDYRLQSGCGEILFERIFLWSVRLLWQSAFICRGAGSQESRSSHHMNEAPRMEPSGCLFHKVAVWE